MIQKTRWQDWIRFGFGVVTVLVALSLWILERGPSAVAAEPPPPEIVWSIGKLDGYSIEFAPGKRDQLTYVIGRNVPEKDFSGQHQGSTSLVPSVPDREKPYTIVFDLDGPPRGTYELVLAIIFTVGAPERVKVQVNARKGIFPILPVPKDDLDSAQANTMLLSKQQLDVPIDAAWLKQTGNEITLTPLGAGEISYDALVLRHVKPGASSPPPAPRVEPTIFYRKGEGQLREISRVLIPFNKPFRKGTVLLRTGRSEFTRGLVSAGYDFGVIVESFEVPVPAQPATATLRVTLDGRSQQVQQEFVPSRQWKVYICPKVHNDVGFTDIQPHVNELDTRNTDTVLDILEKYPSYKFNFETGWLVDNYLESRPPEHQRRFYARAAEHRAAINAFYLNLMTGLASGEELYRAMYFTYALRRKHGSSFDFACLTDAPSHTWFLPSLLTDVGIKVFSNGSNQTRAPILQFSDLNENSPFYWEGINGERIMMWYARSYLQLKRLTNINYLSPLSSYEYMKAAVPQFLLRYMRDDYHPDAVMIYGAYVDNAAVPEDGEAPLIEKWNQEYEFPKLIVATDADYFTYVEKHFADRLRVNRGDAGAYWEDGAASTAHATKLNRHSQQILPAAETVAAFATLFEPRNRYPKEDFWSAWRNVLFYDEHTWGAYNSISQPDREFVRYQWEIKESYATRANLDARNLLARSLNRLFQSMAVGGDTIFAINLQNRPRSAPLEVEIDSGRHLVDLSTGQPAPLDVVSEQDGWRRVRFMAENVLPLGYKGYELRSTAAAQLEQEPATGALRLAYGAEKGGKNGKKGQPSAATTIESRYYRLDVDPRTGGVLSLFDKEEGRELVDRQAPFKLNQYLYVSGGANTLIIDNVYGRPLAQLSVASPDSARIIEATKTPLGQRITVEMSSKNTPRIRTEYILYDGLKRLDILNTFTKQGTRDKEAVYWAFPFDAKKPRLEYQIQNGWVRPNEDQLPGACREWFATQNLVHVIDGEYSIAWATPDSPLITLTDINRGKWPRHLEIKNGHVFSYVLTNYWFTNYKASQEGEFAFRYAITSGRRMSREQLAWFDSDTRVPVFAYPLLSSFSASVEAKARPLPAAQGSLMVLEAPNLQFVALKVAEDNDGYVLRVRETAGRSGEAEVQFPHLRIKEAHLANGVEVAHRRLQSSQHSVRIPYASNQYVTVRLKAEAVVGQ